MRFRGRGFGRCRKGFRRHARMVAMATMSGGWNLLLFAGRRFFLVGLGVFGSRRTHAAGFDRRDKKARLGPILGRMCERPRNRSGCKEKGQEEEDHPSH